MSSTDLLAVTGKDKKPDLISPNKKEDQEKKTILDIPSLLAANEKTTPLSGSSDILSRVQAFLPQMKEANEQLRNADPSKLDIENVDEDQQYIEMVRFASCCLYYRLTFSFLKNLGLGVFEEKKDDSDSEEEEEEEEEIKIPKQASSSGKIEEI
ncbi:hypothetical protein BD560DRAFT_381962 [Blakeslea trispora]|nr:hypothetical protein BD560DRAFT_381962 [Blakeslea trispora]